MKKHQVIGIILGFLLYGLLFIFPTLGDFPPGVRLALWCSGTCNGAPGIGGAFDAVPCRRLQAHDGDATAESDPHHRHWCLEHGAWAGVRQVFKLLMKCCFGHAGCRRTVTENEILRAEIGQNLKFLDTLELPSNIICQNCQKKISIFKNFKK